MKKLITWLYTRYVLLPEIRKAYGEDVELLGEQISVEFVPDDEFEAQIEKDLKGPIVH